MRMHAIQTGTVAVKQRQGHGAGQRIQRRVSTMLDRALAEPLPIAVEVIEHPAWPDQYWYVCVKLFPS